MTKEVKKTVGALAAVVVVFAAFVAFKAIAYAKLSPGPDERTFAGFARTPRADRELVWIDHEGHRLLVARGPTAPALTFPSGPAAYVFDEKGEMIDWTPDVGDTPRLDFAQTGGVPVTREAALEALGGKP